MTSLKQQHDLLGSCFSDLCRCLAAAMSGSPEDRRASALDPDRIGEACEILAELSADLWSMDPDLVDPLVAPRFSSDLSSMIRTLETQLHPIVRGQTWDGVYEYLPDAEVKRLQRAGSERARLDLLRTWWAAHAAGFQPFEKIERELRGETRWRRVHAARHLRDLGGPNVLDAVTGDVDRAALDRWCRARRDPAGEP